MSQRRLPSRRPSARVLSEALETRTLFALTGPLFAGEAAVGKTALTSVLARDFTGDGKTDVVTYTSNTLLLYAGNGDGTLADPVTVATGVYTGIAAADFNGDGKIDLVAGSGTQVLLGNGNGTFAAPAAVNTGGFAGGVATGDFNGDGKIDIVTGSGNSRITIVPGKGDGTFLAPITLMSGVSDSTTSLAVGDFNGDGKLDVAETKSTTNIYVYLGNGNGTLGVPLSIPFGVTVTNVVALDADQDGLSDLVAGSSFSIPRFARANGNGSFAPAVTLPVNAFASALATADFNGDGRPDIAAGGSRTSMLLNTGSGTFASSVDSYTPTTSFIAAADFNIDGKTDLVRIQTVASVVIDLGNGDGTLSVTPPTNVALPNYSIDGLVSADLNHDGNADFVSPDFANGPTIVLGNGHGGGTVVGAPAGSGAAGTVVLADINGDGNIDLLTNRANTPVFLGNGNGTFHAGATLTIPSNPRRGFVVFDLDNDGKLDIITRGSNSFVQWLRGNGDGTFRAIATLGTSSSPVAATGLYAVDVNGDGKPDLAFGDDDGGTSFRLNNGSGGFSTSYVTLSALMSGPVASGDFNGDGKIDLAVTYDDARTGSQMPPTGGGFWVRFGNGDGTFSTTASALKVSSAMRFAALTAADLDGDGKTDLIASGRDGIAIYRGNSTTAFASVRALPLALIVATTTVAGDFDHDGKIDLMTQTDNFALVFNPNIGIDPTTPPAVASSSYRVNENVAAFTFDRPMNPATIAAADLQVTNLTTSTTSNAAAGFALSADGKTITFTLPNNLPAGDYRFRLPAGSIASATNVATSVDASLSGPNVFNLPGDINHDRTVNFDDLIILAQNYNTTGKTFSQGNVDRSAGGEVNFDDLIILAQQYNKSLAALPAIAATPAAVVPALSEKAKKSTRVADSIL